MVQIKHAVPGFATHVVRSPKIFRRSVSFETVILAANVFNTSAICNVLNTQVIKHDSNTVCF